MARRMLLPGSSVRSRPRTLSRKRTNRRELSVVTHKASLLSGAALAILCTHCWRPVLAQEAAPSQSAGQPAELTEDCPAGYRIEPGTCYYCAGGPAAKQFLSD